ncbi:aminoglycoside phosphotransferase family protein [Spirillospora sp. NPDC029432]|uniref:phosphotransferase family protein n=1 Tax=Spirillospora sp. NPDC029432 TaxID=3154599 RepID=UPI003456A743
MDLVTQASAPCAPPGAPPSRTTLRWVEECLGRGAEVRMVRPLAGGAAHANHALLVESPSGSAHRLVLRRWTPRARTAGPPVPRGTDADFSPEREIAALALLAGCEVPTPSLVAADPAGAYCDAPALLITRLKGHPPRPAPDDLPEYLIQLAAALLAVHARGGASTMPPYVPYNRLDQRRAPRHALRPGLWERAFEVAAGRSPEAAHRFIHRDYHPDNTLWSYGRLTGIVDWSDASYGPVAVDIAHMRLNLALRYGPPAAERFVAAFDQVSGGYRHDPYWDVRCLLDLLPEDDGSVLDEATMPLIEDYLARLLAAV